jgi:hypothetical protein
MDYTVNKGTGKPAEFQGLKSQYLFIFAGGLLSLFVVFVVMYMTGLLKENLNLIAKAINFQKFMALL